jgi:uncharacterized protein (DUF433 family)
MFASNTTTSTSTNTSAGMAFSVQTAARLADLSEDRVRYWADHDVLRPSLADRPDVPFGRIYTFRDVVGLRTLKLLRDTHHFSLQALRQIGAQLARHYDAPWSELRFYVVGDRLAFSAGERDQLLAARPLGQALLKEVTCDITRVAAEVESATRRLRERQTDDHGQIAQHRSVLQNQPVVQGTRIPTATIWNYHVAGFSDDDILRQYPTLTPDDIQAAIEHESEQQRPGRAAS